MLINKVYNHKFLDSINNYIEHKIDSDKTKHIYNQLNKHLVFTDFFDLFDIVYINRSINTVNLLYNKLFKDQYDHDKFALLYETDKIDYNKNELKKHLPEEWPDAINFYDKSFMSYIILQYFENECNKLIKMVSKDGKYNIYIYYCSSHISDNKLENIIYHIHNILNWIIKIGNAKLNKLRLDVILSPFNKTFTYELSEEEYIKYPWLMWTKQIKKDGLYPFHINTGSSWKTKNHIILYRIDELFKVLFHECIHSFKYDFDDDNDCKKKNCENILSKNVSLKIGFPGSYPILINEAYTEYMAILCWNYYLASYYLFSNNKTSMIKDKFKLFSHMINREQINSAITCTKLFNYYDMTDLSILKKYNHISQKTNAFSYIFIKYILLIKMVGIFENKSVDNLNRLLIDELDIINKYDYLLKIPVDEDNKINLSIYYINV